MSSLSRLCFSSAGVCLALIFLQACNSGLTQSDLDKIRDIVKTKGADPNASKSKGALGPINPDDDAPLTMAGGSMSITLWGDNTGWKVDSQNQVFSHPDENQRFARSIEYWNLDADPAPFRWIKTKAWTILVHYRNSRSDDRPVTFATDANATNLALKADRTKLFGFRRVGLHLLEHPRKGGDVKTIEIDGAIARMDMTSDERTAAANDQCTFDVGTGKWTCTCGTNNDKGDCGLVIHYCASAANTGPCKM